MVASLWYLQNSSQVIRDQNLSDSQMLGVLKKLRRHWKGGVPPGIQKALVEKKKLLNNFFTKVTLTLLRLNVSPSFAGEAGR